MIKKIVPAFYLLTCSAVFGGDYNETELTVIKPLAGDEIYVQQFTFNFNTESFAKECSRLDSSLSAPKTGTPTTQKTKVKHEMLGEGDVLLQHEADAAMILNRFQGDFLKTTLDYNKLTCKEFCDQIISIYRIAVIAFYKTVEDEVEDMNGFAYKRIADEKALRKIAKNNDVRLPKSVEDKIAQSITDYLDRLTFSLT